MCGAPRSAPEGAGEERLHRGPSPRAPARGWGRDRGLEGGQGGTGPSDAMLSLCPHAGSHWLAAERITRLVLLVVCSEFL